MQIIIIIYLFIFFAYLQLINNMKLEWCQNFMSLIGKSQRTVITTYLSGKPL